ncbi:hypothetical protein RM572_00560 [Streptomyces sp. DSM 42041]|uniref:Uncharacterized protein n=1 Tax=Streptomyces hazeniae TaxID=3075538 RepID=A0ABU2NMI3_9ACTN|nr:hypothetical protein [Streptomyces sp. DSM 42041]MDT0377267.1 hypothetical protein [Streptomyces sp. DSM 42041]
MEHTPTGRSRRLAITTAATAVGLLLLGAGLIWEHNRDASEAAAVCGSLEDTVDSLFSELDGLEVGNPQHDQRRQEIMVVTAAIVVRHPSCFHPEFVATSRDTLTDEKYVKDACSTMGAADRLAAEC